MGRKQISQLALWSMLGVGFLLSVFITEEVSRKIPEPYMDEYFHHDQAYNYVVNNDFNYWNDKITTFPGLYLVQYPLIKMIMALGIASRNLLILSRAVNAFVFGLASIYYCYKTLTYLYPEMPILNVQRTLMFYFMPINFFFNFLFYTDSGSTLFILMTFYYTVTRRYTAGGLFAVISVLFRQTNIVWVGYICLWRIIRDKRHHFAGEARLDLGHQITELISILIKDLKPIIRRMWIYFGLLVVFSIFLWKNKGVVVEGDRSNHQMSFHPTQMLYLILFVLPNTGISFSHHLMNFRLSVIRIFHNKTLGWIFILITMVFMVIVHYFTIAHPFILADNRHYTFYIWKNFFGRFWFFKYLLCPVYSAAVLYLIPIIISTREKPIILAIWVLCTFCALTPSPLIEFRYFTIPWLFLQFEVKPFHVEGEDKIKPKGALGTLFSSLIPNVLGYLIVNVIAFYMFLYKPFVYDSSTGEIGRFMW